MQRILTSLDHKPGEDVFRFLDLPAELRNKIYRESFCLFAMYSHTLWQGRTDFRQPALLRASKQLRHEGLPIFYAETQFQLFITHDRSHDCHKLPDKWTSWAKLEHSKMERHINQFTSAAKWAKTMNSLNHLNKVNIDICNDKHSNAMFEAVKMAGELRVARGKAKDLQSQEDENVLPCCTLQEVLRCVKRMKMLEARAKEFLESEEAEEEYENEESAEDTDDEADFEPPMDPECFRHLRSILKIMEKLHKECPRLTVVLRCESNNPEEANQERHYRVSR